MGKHSCNVCSRMDPGVGPKGPRCLDAFSSAELVVLPSRAFQALLPSYKWWDMYTQICWPSPLPGPQSASGPPLGGWSCYRAPSALPVATVSCWGGLQTAMVTSLLPAAPVPAYIDNIRHLKCLLRDSIPYCGVHDGGVGGTPHSIHLGSFGTMLKIELSKVCVDSSVANHQREAEPRRREGVEK